MALGRAVSAQGRGAEWMSAGDREAGGNMGDRGQKRATVLGSRLRDGWGSPLFPSFGSATP